MSAHDGTQPRQFIHRPGFGADIVTYTFRLAWFLPDAGPVWVRDFGRDDCEVVANVIEACSRSMREYAGGAR